MNHTKEPWAVCPGGYPGAPYILPAKHDQYTASICSVTQLSGHPMTEHPESTANANRIVSCVNALAGVNNPQKFRRAFDDMLGSIRESVKEFEILEKERPDATWIGRILDNNRMILKQAQEALGVTSPAD